MQDIIYIKSAHSAKRRNTLLGLFPECVAKIYDPRIKLSPLKYNAHKQHTQRNCTRCKKELHDTPSGNIYIMHSICIENTLHYTHHSTYSQSGVSVH